MTEFFKNLIAPPRCVGCGERLSVFDGSCEKAFCEKCRGRWERAKSSICSICKQENVDCSCNVKTVKNTRTISLIKFGEDACCDRLIYALKRHRNERFFDFAADELCKRLKREEKMLITDLSGAVFVNVPRSIKTKNSFGFDHAQILASSLAESMSGEYCRALLRRYGGKAQKRLGANKRQKNVENRFIFNESKNINGRTVILVDDVLTTGATASECVKVLRANGAADVIFISIARSAKKKAKK